MSRKKTNQDPESPRAETEAETRIEPETETETETATEAETETAESAEGLDQAADGPLGSGGFASDTDIEDFQDSDNSVEEATENLTVGDAGSDGSGEALDGDLPADVSTENSLPADSADDPTEDIQEAPSTGYSAAVDAGDAQSGVETNSLENNQVEGAFGQSEANASSSIVSTPQRQLQVPDSAISRFRRWLGGSTVVGKPLQNPSPKMEASDPQAATIEVSEQEDHGLSAEDATEELDALEKSRVEWSEYLVAQEQVAQDLKDRIGHQESQLNDLNTWVSQYGRSYQWRVQERMDQQLAKAEADLQAYENSARNVEEFEPGRLVELRKQFHKLIGLPTVVALLVAVSIILLPILFRIPKLDALETFYDPRLSAPIIFLAVAAIVTVVLLVRRALGKDRIQNVTIARWILLAFFLGLLVIAMPTLEVPIRNNLIPFIEEYLLFILGVIAAVVLTWVLIALSIYYQGWSQYRRGVENQLARLRAVISGYVETRQEVNRLSLLYQQTADWLEILAHALYRPWAVDPTWEEKRRVESDFKDLPFSLRIAQVDDQAGAKSAELERIISTKLLVQGWRAQAFEDLINHIALDLGIGVSKFNVETLDRDLPHQTNNTRNVLRGYLDASAGREGESIEEHSERNPHLVEVARQRLKVLIQQTQSVALSAARPSVSQMIQNPLDSIDFEGNSSSRRQLSEDWDSFLKESLGTEEIIKPPLSILGLSSKGKMNKAGENPFTFIVIPERLRKALPDEANGVSEIVAVSDYTARPVEIIARMDVSQPLEPVDLRLLEAEPDHGVSDQRRTSTREIKASAICPECHDHTCPASVNPALPCVNAGI
jgi:hypothetical protein